ncbi:hypothetical protein [Oerskovia enterophila]|nr:hypothetical protein [Oerskovia enterophila]
MICDLAHLYGIDLYDPAVLARPWPGIRTMILSLLHRPSALADRIERSTP